MPSSLSEAIALFGGEARHRSYPVVAPDGTLQGLVSRTDALHWQMNGTDADATLADVLSDASQPVGTTDDPISRIADLMVDSGVGRIPIVEPAGGRVIGVLTRHDLLKVRHHHYSAEQARSAWAN